MSIASQCRLQARSIALLARCPTCHNFTHRLNLSRSLQTDSQTPTPLRKHLKDEAKRKKRSSQPTTPPSATPIHHDYELTVGIEVHARLNTSSKLFSPALLTPDEVPNTHVAGFDFALPGSQPRFQTAALIPAIRAALALGCTIKRRSGWDRKHYFYQDQPNGYQITQYYEPFAVNGTLELTGTEGGIGIKQVQLEQDTAKTTQHVGSENYLIDYSRVGAPLIEIITLPQIHSPQAAAETVRRIRDLLRAVDACSGNMDRGDLRADVNVSVRRRNGPAGSHSYAGVAGLGTRTEIKNLNSFRSVEEAVAAERDRQIRVLEGGGVVVGETRGWTIGGTETTRLRSKEGEVDYRYMPDPDLGPVFIEERLVEDLRRSMPELPEKVVERIMADFDLSLKDATTLLTLDDGERLEFAAETFELVLSSIKENDRKKVAKTAANWTLHEIGGLLASGTKQWEELLVTSQNLADIISNLLQRQITGRSAKQLLQAVFDGTSNGKSIDQLIEDGNMRLRPMSEDEYTGFAQTIIAENPDAVAAIQKGQRGKVMFFVGQMMRRADEGTVEADKAKQVIERLLGL